MKVHLIGIGGIGVSALAQYYLKKGDSVSGSDLSSSESIEDLKKRGVAVFIGPHDAGNLKPGIELVVHSPAVNKDNPELKQAKMNNLRVLSYPEALGQLSKEYFTIAVSGTHGKSTTTAMLSLLLIKAGFDPTVIIGTKLKEFHNSNFRFGNSKYLIIEADEHFSSFLNYWPQMIVLTNIEADHLDHYKNLSNVMKAFSEYISHLGDGGTLVFNGHDKNILKIIKKKKNNISLWKFSLDKEDLKKIRSVLNVPGDHNAANAMAALEAARALGISDEISFAALAQYSGSWRRFEESEIQIERKKIILISDYAHHPTEVLAALKAAREKYKDLKIWCIFQPHQYQRTFFLLNDFIRVLKAIPIDRMIVTDIFDVAGREGNEFKKKIDSEKMVNAVKRSNVVFSPKENLLNIINRNYSEIDVLIVMGAGDIYKLY